MGRQQLLWPFALQKVRYLMKLACLQSASRSYSQAGATHKRFENNFIQSTRVHSRRKRRRKRTMAKKSSKLMTGLLTLVQQDQDLRPSWNTAPPR